MNSWNGLFNITDVAEHNPVVSIYQGNEAGYSYKFTNTVISVAQRDAEGGSDPTNDYGMVLGIGGHPNIGLRTHTGNGYPSASIELVHGYWNYANLGTNSDTNRLSYKKVIINSNGNTFFNGGNVGIGTDSPATKLHVKNNGETFRVEGTDHTFISFYEGSTRVGYMGYADSNDDFFRINTHNGTSYNDLYLEAANVGIGTTSPKTLLDIYSTTASATCSAFNISKRQRG